MTDTTVEDQTKTVYTVFRGRPQIDGWLALKFAADRNHIEDHYDRLQFLQDVLENDLLTIADGWPEFVAYCKAQDNG